MEERGNNNLTKFSQVTKQDHHLIKALIIRSSLTSNLDNLDNFIVGFGK
jgi:hypothetical protein